MHTKTRKSNLKHRRKTSFRRRMKTVGGRKVIRRQRARMSGRPKQAPR